MKRFWKEVATEPVDGGYRVTLDGKPIRTQGGNPQVVPTEALARAMAEEWRAQGEEIDPSRFVMRDMADMAIDLIAPDPSETIDKLLAFAETDTLCYRADPDEPLYRRQIEVWEPLLTAMEAREGVTMQRVSGIMHRPQSTETLAALRKRVAGFDAFTLVGLQAMTSLAASLCIGLKGLATDADPDALWSAAILEEEWQVELWGRDPVAEDRRAAKKHEFLSAHRFAQLAAC